MSNLQDIKDQVAAVPMSPGVYIWKDAKGEVLYVGKAKQLRARMRQYVTMQDSRAMIPMLMQQVASFEYIVVESEHESLILEKNLINQYSPPFNVDFKDDKSYPYIALTKGDVFPALKYTREKPRQDTRYFGPYTDARAARETIDIARRVVPICTTNCVEWKRLKRWLDREGSADALAPARLETSEQLRNSPLRGSNSPRFRSRLHWLHSQKLARKTRLEKH
ncbi:MAG: GIY-YIG nuclease family protein, partial [Coriobacteriales bacterium]|nr:GIY-YIG nuclease family protein [Coriobacteriales bacterium]